MNSSTKQEQKSSVSEKPSKSSFSKISLESEPPAKVRTSIMSAPPEKKTPYTTVIIVALIVSVALNILALVFLLSNSATISLLRSENDSYKEDILDLKNQLNSLESF
ncbi:hypothetical protein IKG02_03050 [Candidatus Saccharibacteria bacterium]|nr:hypothetical protein [Candidatus Saccharibacteria bacterium]